jgi:hypothetical protein
MAERCHKDILLAGKHQEKQFTKSSHFHFLKNRSSQKVHKLVATRCLSLRCASFSAFLIILGSIAVFSLSIYRTNEVGKIKQENSTFFVGWVIFFHLDVSVAKLTNSNIPTKEQVWKSYSIPKCLIKR